MHNFLALIPKIGGPRPEIGDFCRPQLAKQISQSILANLNHVPFIPPQGLIQNTVYNRSTIWDNHGVLAVEHKGDVFVTCHTTTKTRWNTLHISHKSYAGYVPLNLVVYPMQPRPIVYRVKKEHFTDCFALKARLNTIFHEGNPTFCKLNSEILSMIENAEIVDIF